MSYKRALAYLYRLESPTFKLGLDRIRELLDKAGNPEKRLKVIHVGGTNGKGSVCSMIASALEEAGYKVGLYTSPHLKKFNERIRINGRQITDKEVVKYFLKLKPHIKNQSFFEITTAMAFLYFMEKNVDFAVIEVGLGGRLDATNVITPLISVITNVGLEHTDLLGKTIEKIAFEKSGIIKKGVPIVTGAKGNALKVVKKIAKERNAPCYLVKKQKRIEFRYLYGDYQQQNKDLAITSIDILKKYHHLRIGEKQIVKGIEKARWPGRLQFISKNVLIDGAHNPHGFEALTKEVINIKKNKKIRNLIFVIGFQHDKDIASIFKIIKPLASMIVFTKSKNEKACKPEYLMKLFNRIYKNNTVKKIIISDPRKALEYAKRISRKDDLIVVVGSIYMVGEVM